MHTIVTQNYNGRKIYCRTRHNVRTIGDTDEKLGVLGPIIG